MSAHDPTPQQVIKALQDTRALIAQGWCRGKAQDGDAYCLVGALAEATITDSNTNVPGYLVWRHAREALETHVPMSYPNLVAYNDFTGQQAVLTLIDKTIKHITEQGAS